MKRVPVLTWVLRTLVFSALLGTASAQTAFFWTGFGTGWQGQTTPPNNGTALFYLQDAINEKIALPTDLSIYAVYLVSDDTYVIAPAAGATLPLTLSLSTGVLIANTNAGRIKFDPNVNLNLSGSPVFDTAGGTTYVSGHITGTLGTFSLTSSNVGSSGAYIFNNTGTGNTYTGNTLIAPVVAGAQPVVTFWNSSPFSTGTVTIADTATLIAHNTQTLANPFVFSSTTANVTAFKSWDAPLTLSGNMTLATNTTLQAVPGQQGIASVDNAGIFPTPGAPSRNPIVITGTIGQAGVHSLTIGGAGVMILQPGAGINSYTGGTVVNGSLIFGNNNAIPTGASNVVVNASGYAGIGDTSAGNFATQLAHINAATSTGAVGVDTLPGNSTITYAGAINLSGFTNTSIRVGTATSAILTGTITPKGPDYQFGNGGGSLFVQSNLPNVSTVSQLVLNDALNNALVFPLKLYLRGTNTYTGGTVANNGFVIFDGVGSIPASGQLTASGNSTTTGASYVGYTDAVSPMTPATFLSKFNLANTWGIIGFDTHAGNSVVNVNGTIDLSNFNHGVFLGTATFANLTGTITPTSDNILRLTAANGGILTVKSDITNGSVVIGSPAADYHYGDGIVVLNPATANTYSGGTTFNDNNPLTLMVGGTTPLGNGPLTILNNTGNYIGLQAVTANYTLANNIVFQNTGTGITPSFYLTGANSMTLAGTISGLGELGVVNTTATLTADNSAFSGPISLLNGTLFLNHNNAAGTGTVYFNGVNSDSVIFSGPATNPVLYGIKGDSGSLVLGAGNVLTFDVSNPNSEHEFGGSIGAGGPVAASVVVTAGSGNEALYLFGNSNYTGGTTIDGHGGLGVGQNTSLGSGPVTLNSNNATLALNQGVVLTNALNYNAGTLQGFGTFAPSNLPIITFDSNKSVIPGLLKIGDQSSPGSLTLASNVVFANGGNFGWTLQDVSRSDGASHLLITGNLDLTTISANGFLIDVITLDPLGNPGFANLTIGTPYTFTLLTVNGTISGFSPTKFALNTILFENGVLPASVFNLTADVSNIYLTFTAVPEPSTWLLLGSGASLLGLGALRRRRSRVN